LHDRLRAEEKVKNMLNHADKSHANHSRTVANQPLQKKERSKATFAFADNRPEATQLASLQAMMHNSPHAPRRRAMQELPDNSPRTVAQRQQSDRMVGGAAPRQAAPQEEALQMKAQVPPVQRQEGLDEDDELQRKAESAALQRQPEPEEEELLQGKFAPIQRQGPDDDERHMQQASSAPAQFQPEPLAPRNTTGLPDHLKSGIESLSGISMDAVNVHYNSSQPAQLNALAYAQGRDIHIAPGQVHHLPHEAWHVVQQAQGRVNPTMQMQDGVQINDDAGLEHEADVMGGRAAVQRVSQSIESDPIDFP
jgi:hypothetical protein